MTKFNFSAFKIYNKMYLTAKNVNFAYVLFKTRCNCNKWFKSFERWTKRIKLQIAESGDGDSGTQATVKRSVVLSDIQPRYAMLRD